MRSLAVLAELDNSTLLILRDHHIAILCQS